MNKSFLTIALTLTCLFGLGVTARAQDKVNVKVPFEFVAGGKTLPAGTYSVGRANPDGAPGLIIYSREGSVIVLPTAVGEPSGRATLSFDKEGDKYFLTEVNTTTGVYSMALPQTRTIVAVAKDHGAGSSASGN